MTQEKERLLNRVKKTMRWVAALATVTCSLLLVNVGVASAGPANWSTTGPASWMTTAGPLSVTIGGATAMQGCVTSLLSSGQATNSPTPGAYSGNGQNLPCSWPSASRVAFGGPINAVARQENGSYYLDVVASSVYIFKPALYDVIPQATFTVPWTNGTSPATPSRISFASTVIGTTQVRGEQVALTGAINVQSGGGGVLTLN